LGAAQPVYDANGTCHISDAATGEIVYSGLGAQVPASPTAAL